MYIESFESKHCRIKLKIFYIFFYGCKNEVNLKNYKINNIFFIVRNISEDRNILQQSYCFIEISRHFIINVKSSSNIHIIYHHLYIKIY